MTDTYGNKIKYVYNEEQRCSGDTYNYEDRASYLFRAYYDNLDQATDPTTWGVRIDLNRTIRTGDGDEASCGKLFSQSDRLTNVAIYNNVTGAMIHVYWLYYQMFTDTERNGATPARELTSITETGYDPANPANSISYPATTFTYATFPTHDPDCTPGLNCGDGPGNCLGSGGGWNGWCGPAAGNNGNWAPDPPNHGNGTYDCRYLYSYAFWQQNGDNPAFQGNPVNCKALNFWHLATVTNGYGAVTTFVYANDNRGAFWADGWNYRVTQRLIADGIQGTAEWDYSYGKPCYDSSDSGAPQGSGGVLCELPSPSQHLASLLAHDAVTVTAKDYGGAILSITRHRFNNGSGTNMAVNKLIGREVETDEYDAGMNLLRYQVFNDSYTDGAYGNLDAHLDSQANYQCVPGSACVARQTNVYYDAYQNIVQLH